MFTLLPKRSNRLGGARSETKAVDLPARSFDLARLMVQRRHWEPRSRLNENIHKNVTGAAKNLDRVLGEWFGSKFFQGRKGKIYSDANAC